jgi:hypothetical protein
MNSPRKIAVLNPEILTVKSMVGRVHPSESTAIGTPADEFCHLVAIQSLAEHLTLKTENSPQNPRNITFILLSLYSKLRNRKGGTGGWMHPAYRISMDINDFVGPVPSPGDYFNRPLTN